jgi:hypothetical protein
MGELIMPARLPRWSHPLFFVLLAGPMLLSRLPDGKSEELMERAELYGDAVGHRIEKWIVRAITPKDGWVLRYSPPSRPERPIRTRVEVQEPTLAELEVLGFTLDDHSGRMIQSVNHRGGAALALSSSSPERH